MTKKTTKKLSDLSDSQLLLIVECNKTIKTLNSYGMRKITTNHLCYRSNWSNNGKNWWIYHGLTEKNKELQLDANEFLINCHDQMLRENIIEILPHLDDLPLYSYSTEAKLRGETPDNVNELVKELRKRAIEKDPQWGKLSITEF